ncbi:P-type conjugative transfer protein TrbL [Phenylobacterium aquaticum]|uniref:P-type conjugative transfer protein TrbL n=1 Tax=Phenylobacterium aquaticum TaxID=1763816 RepID=UPI001F5DFB0F|nr:P-type conjugative transfer protein TrbL [Phenylobacterium aquaticum]MCI3130991.1 P-type conjugative transfer protein TrbL [Phenylobacterium aquaticum]
MATASPAALDDFIRRFTTQIDTGFGVISGEVQTVLGTLVVISIALTAILWAIDETQNVLASLVRKVLLVGFFAWLVGSWHTLSLTVVNGFGQLGLRASGGGSVDDFMNAPTTAVDAGMQIVVKLMAYIGELAKQNGGFGALQNIDVIIVAAVAAIGILLAFIVLAIEIAITIIEFHLVTLIAFVTVPFGVLSQTSFLAERAIGYVVSVGLKFMALAVILGIGINIFQQFTLSLEPTISEECGLLLSAVFLMMLALKIPSIAGALISGGPQLNAGGALMGAAGVAAGAAGVALAGRAIGGAVAGGWAAGGEKVAAARAASGGLGSGSAGPAGGGGGSGGGGMAADFARAPVSTMVAEGRAAGSRLFSSRNPNEGEAPPPPPPDAPSSGSSVVSRAQARRGGGLAGAARDSAAAATAGGEASGPGLSATPTRRDDDPEE